MHKQKTWALVADGVRARILRGLEHAHPNRESHAELTSRSRSRHLRDIMFGKSAGSGPSAGSGRRLETVCGNDPIKQDMREFAITLLDQLDSHRRAGELERLALFASPAMLGVLREQMPQTLCYTVCLERGINLMPLNERDLRAAVIGALQLGPADEAG